MHPHQSYKQNEIISIKSKEFKHEKETLIDEITLKYIIMRFVWQFKSCWYKIIIEFYLCKNSLNKNIKMKAIETFRNILYTTFEMSKIIWVYVHIIK